VLGADFLSRRRGLPKSLKKPKKGKRKQMKGIKGIKMRFGFKEFHLLKNLIFVHSKYLNMTE